MATRNNDILKVLIADDDHDDRYFIDLAFKEAALGHTVNFVTDGNELVQYLENLHSVGRTDNIPDLILLDLNMPKKDGREALRELHADPRFANLNVVIFSTTISEQDRSYTSLHGAADHVIKPFDFADLVQTIKNICGAYATPQFQG